MPASAAVRVIVAAEPSRCTTRSAAASSSSRLLGRPSFPGSLDMTLPTVTPYADGRHSFLARSQRGPARAPEVAPRVRRGGHPSGGPRVGRARGDAVADPRGGGEGGHLLPRLHGVTVVRRVRARHGDRPGGAVLG